QNKSKLTDNQQKEFEKLINKRDTKEISQGAKTFCENWLKDEIFQKKIFFSNKQTKKGNICEDLTIKRYNDTFGTFYSKYTGEPLENDYIIGTPDAFNLKKGIDAKNAYNHSTFPLFKHECCKIDYNWQALGYMDLTSLKEWEIVYSLENLPPELIEIELNKLELEYTEENEAMFTYDNVPNELRIRVFPIEYSNEKIELIYQQVELCRKYINSLIY
ncbi:MAG: hypothetical protein ACRC0V_12775, partial [Fusobacteriaceae bacterium]